MLYHTYHIPSGHKIARIEGPLPDDLPFHIGLIEGELDDNTYVIDGQVAARETVEVAVSKTELDSDGIDAVVIAAPFGAWANIDGSIVESINGVFAITARSPGVILISGIGRYRFDVRVTAGAPKDWEKELDAAVDAIRARYPTPGQYVVEEYRLTADHAEAFKRAGYAGNVPPCVDSWARASGFTAREAADDILSTRDLYNLMLIATRDARLNGKAAIKTASTAQERKSIYHSTLTTLEAALPPVV